MIAEVWSQNPLTISSLYWDSGATAGGNFAAFPWLTTTGVIQFSPDGTTWFASAVGETRDWASLAGVSGRILLFAKTGDNSVFYTTDGLTWTKRLLSLPFTTRPTMFATNGDTIVGASYGGSKTAASYDAGDTWALSSTVRSGEVLYLRPAYGNGIFFLLTSNSYHMTSTDGLTWTEIARRLDIGSGRVDFVNGLFRIDQETTAWTSPDAVTWTSTARAANIVIPTTALLKYIGGEYILVGGATQLQIHTSADAVTFALRETIDPSTPYYINLYDDTAGTFVSIKRSSDVAYTSLGAPSVPPVFWTSLFAQEEAA